MLILTGCLLCCSSLKAGPQSSKKYWVYFIDKGAATPAAGSLAKNSSLFQKALTIVQPRALLRRSKVLPGNNLLTAEDLPLNQKYIDDVTHAGGLLQQKSRWLNAASYLLTPDQVSIVAQFSFVKSVEPVAVLYGHKQPEEFNPSSASFSKTTSLDYGPSLNQNSMINVIPLHSIGITGRGVLVGMLDTGFRWRVHEALNTRHVIGEYDFIQHDTVTANQICDSTTYRCDRSDQDAHGTATLSTLGGFMPGQLIGPAFDADFILSKTEYVQVDDSSWEEDNWAAGIEWEEANGVDVVSSSVGYNTFFDAPDYTWANGDFNGRTSITAKAAVRAAELGVTVCNAMGNQGNGNGSIGTMLTPADADSIISVGAVSFSRVLTSFSSTGPTNDNRIKPEVVAPGLSVHCASTTSSSSYYNLSGTSLATPLTAGAAALILSARPELTPIQVRDALRTTADTVDAGRYPIRPNNFTGWGLVNAFNAALSFGPIFSNVPAMTVASSSSVVTIITVSKFGIRPNQVKLHYAVDPDTTFSTIAMSLDSSMFFPTSGQYKVTIPSQITGTLVKFYIDAQDSSNYSYRSPAAVTGKIWQLNYGVTGIGNTQDVPSGYTLSQNYPNPFNPNTTIRYTLAKTQFVILRIYNVLGQEVKTLVHEQQTPGLKNVEFNADGLPSGVYFYRLVTPSFAATKKMMLLR